jgi:hypothetical protein
MGGPVAGFQASFRVWWERVSIRWAWERSWGLVNRLDERSALRRDLPERLELVMAKFSAWR